MIFAYMTMKMLHFYFKTQTFTLNMCPINSCKWKTFEYREYHK